ncbi:hypothetical protein [Okeania sp. KiyG1]|uniref:hypothetical protein n=1 Tax=Okeania sp. KiyG1 TaxID=2720165 RepID=UPI00192112A2|nr:hypothetical protein [Okeania sp. KiyG1]GGA14239.1 hypothetical protein CYANOKiyG1_27640 [Okeania sp. KiyG1]
MSKGLAKTRLSKSINDAGWGQFLTILTVKAVSAAPTQEANAGGEDYSCESSKKRAKIVQIVVKKFPKNYQK